MTTEPPLIRGSIKEEGKEIPPNKTKFKNLIFNMLLIYINRRS